MERCCEKAKQLYDRSIIALAHDHVAGIARFGEEDADLLRYQQAGVTVKSLMIQTDALLMEEASEGDRYEESLSMFTGFRQRAEENMQAVIRLIERYPQCLMLARSTEDILVANRSGKCALIFSFEGGKPLEGELDNLDYFYQLGLRHLQLHWACTNQLHDWSPDPASGGLSEFGRRVIRRANELGIVIDPSHAPDKTYYEVIELSQKPIIYGHGSAQGVFRLQRGSASASNDGFSGDMDDARLKALARNGGVLGVHFWSHYLRSDRIATVDDLVDHINYVADLIGIEHVALGPDYVNMPLSRLRPEQHGAKISYVGLLPDLDSPEKLPNLVDRMLARGFAESDIQKVLGENYLRVLKDVIDGSRDTPVDADPTDKHKRGAQAGTRL